MLPSFPLTFAGTSLMNQMIQETQTTPTMITIVILTATFETLDGGYYG